MVRSGIVGLEVHGVEGRNWSLRSNLDVGTGGRPDPDCHLHAESDVNLAEFHAPSPELKIGLNIFYLQCSVDIPA
ncbi:hypothetical protein KAI46_13180 [bacterium]|nr:hypothetical protein [bacterium]